MSLEELMNEKAQILNKWEENINRFIYDPKLEERYNKIVEEIEKLQQEDNENGR